MSLSAARFCAACGATLIPSEAQTAEGEARASAGEDEPPPWLVLGGEDAGSTRAAALPGGNSPIKTVAPPDRLPAAGLPELWLCLVCDTSNEVLRAFCSYCGNRRGARVHETIPAIVELPARRGAPELGVSIIGGDLQVVAGETISFRLEVRNLGAVVERYSCQILGLEPSWATVSPPAIELLPLRYRPSGRSSAPEPPSVGTFTVSIRPPRASVARAGLWPVGVLVVGDTIQRTEGLRRLGLRSCRSGSCQPNSTHQSLLVTSKLPLRWLLPIAEIDRRR